MLSQLFLSLLVNYFLKNEVDPNSPYLSINIWKIWGNTDLSRGINKRTKVEMCLEANERAIRPWWWLDQIGVSNDGEVETLPESRFSSQ